MMMMMITMTMTMIATRMSAVMMVRVKLCGKLTDVLANFQRPRPLHSVMNQFRLMIIKIIVMVIKIIIILRW